MAQCAPGLEMAISQLFRSSNEDFKNAAAFCLGNIASGNLPHYIPIIVNAIRSKQHEYLSLLSLKETISTCTVQNSKTLIPYTNDMWAILFAMANLMLEEGTRNVIAECLGKLVIGQPPLFLPQLKNLLKSQTPATRSTVVSAIKFTFGSSNEEFDSLLAPSIIEFFQLIKDSELIVRKATLSTLNAASHSKPEFVRPILAQLLPLLYHETNVRQDLIIVVEMGPFKHKVDSGEVARKVRSFLIGRVLSNACQRC